MSLLEEIKNFENNYLTVYDIEKLLFSGENINQKDEDGNTLLIFAINYANNDCVELLLKFDIDPNIINNEGLSPLLCAVKKGNIIIIETLLQYNIEYKYIEECISYSIKNNIFDIKNILLDHLYIK